MTYKTQSNVAKDQSADWTFKLIPMKESFEIAKRTDYNDVRYTDGQNIRFGLMATKVVLDPDKNYGDLRIPLKSILKILRETLPLVKKV